MDRKRVNGPEASVVPLSKNTSQEPTPILNKENKRLDNRGIEDIRPVCKFFFKLLLWIRMTTSYQKKKTNLHV